MHSPLVLLLVDVINPLEFPQASELYDAALEMAVKLAKLKRSLGKRVVSVYANDHYGAWLSDFQHVKARCRDLGGTAAKLVELLEPTASDYVLLKPRHSAFYGTPLELLLTQLGCNNLIVGGLATDMCVQMTAADAYLRGFQLWVPQDCSAAQDERQHALSMAYMARVFQADIRDAEIGREDWLARSLPPDEHDSPRRSS